MIIVKRDTILVEVPPIEQVEEGILEFKIAKVVREAYQRPGWETVVVGRDPYIPSPREVIPPGVAVYQVRVEHRHVRTP